jgi:hypothetical protein
VRPAFAKHLVSCRRLWSRDRLRGFDPGLEVQIFRRAACQPSAFYAGFDKFFDVRRHQVQAAKIPIDCLLKAAPRDVVIDAEAVEIKV